MAEDSKQRSFSLTDFVNNQYQNLTQGVKVLIQTASDAWNKKPPSLEGKFPCPHHPTQFITAFVNNPLNQKPYIYCDECMLDQSPLEKPDSKDLIKFDTQKYKPIEDLFDHFLREYGQIRSSFESKNINKIMLEVFLDKIPDMQAQMSLNLEEQKKKFASQTEKAIELFTAQMHSIKEHFDSLLNVEQTTFFSNLTHTRNHITSFLQTLQVFENLPKHEDLGSKISKLHKSDDLVGFIKEYTASVDLLSLKLDSFNSQYSENYQYSLYLMRKTYQYLHKPPKNPASETFTYNPDLHQPASFIKQLEEYVEQNNIPAQLKLDNKILNFIESCPLEGFTSHPRKIEAFQIDSLDFFYPSTPQTLQCLHYHDFDRKVLVLINLGELSQSISHKDLSAKSIVYKIPVPKETKIARYTKTISLPDGSIYFIGGENSAATVMFEYNKELEGTLKHLSRKLSLEEQQKLKDLKNSPSSGLLGFVKKKDSAKLEDGHMHGNFIVKANMNRPKYGHGLVYIGNGSIYSIAGYDTTSTVGYTTKCERYVVKENKWVEIKDCKYAANHPGVCTFDNRYIYKFGGFVNDEGKTLNKIERYHIERDTWTEIEIAAFSGSVQLYPKNLPIQINDQEIMIVGGYTGMFLFSEECAFWRVNKVDEGRVDNKKEKAYQANACIEEEVEKPKELMLPLDNRLVSQSLIYDGKLYCLTLKACVKEVVKNVMVFDGKEWRIVL